MRNLLATPSFYGLITWVSAFILYAYGPIPWNKPSANLWLLFLTGAFSFLASTAFSIFMLNSRSQTPAGWWRRKPSDSPSFYLVAIFHAVGFLGVFKYVSDFGRSMGDISNFQQAFIYQSYLIRMEAESTTSVGFQVSYFGWVAIGLSVLFSSPSRWQRHSLIVLSLGQLVANIAFIDRTRPTWLIFTWVVLLVVTSKRLSLRKLVAFAIAGPVVLLALFIAIGGWIGKTDFNEAFKSERESSILEGPIYYASCGFAYLGWASDHVEPSSEFGHRTLYPLYRAWELVDPSKRPPPQVNEFVNVPLPTNVGTLMEPFVRDGGLIFAIVGALFHSFGFDIIALALRRQASAMGLFLIANLCFTNFIGFFTPKINTFPIWLFFGLALIFSFIRIFNPSRVRY